MAGLKTIPAQVLDAVAAKDEILALQLTENLQREDLDPIDTALAVVGYFQSRHGQKGFDVNGIIDVMILLEMAPDRVKKEVVDTVYTLAKISGKSLRSLERLCSILRLPTEIQNALREGRLGVSQGYLFAANLGHPNLLEIFQAALGEGFTNAGLEKELKRETKPTTGGVRKRPFSLYRRSVRSVKSGIEEHVAAFKKSDLEAMLSDLRELVALVEGRLPASPLQRQDRSRRRKKGIPRNGYRCRCGATIFALFWGAIVPGERIAVYSESVIFRVPPRPRMSCRWM
jgi:ParB-like chromosome segregation protein Spo0J